MIEKLLKITATISGLLLILVCSFSLIYTSFTKEKIYAKDKNVNQEVDYDSTIIINKNEIDDKGVINNDNMLLDTINITEAIGDKYVYVPGLRDADTIEIIDLYRNKSIQITIQGVDKDDFDPLNMKRVNGSKEYVNLSLLQNTSDSKATYVTTSTNNEDASLPISYEHENGVITNLSSINNDSDPVIELQVEYKNLSLENQDVVLTIKLDEVYAPIIYKNEDGIYISLKQPKDIYENILVIDAGHGGKDSGTYSVGEKYYEKDLNLSIVSLLRDTLKDDNIKVYYSRLEDETVYLNPRVALANEVEADLFLSIHFNASESTSAGGSEVLYNELDTSTFYTSKMFASNCLDELLQVTKKVNRGLVNGNEMVIVGNAKMPVALVEVGFMTNVEELNFLIDSSNQKAIADALHNAIIKSFDEINQGNKINNDDK